MQTITVWVLFQVFPFVQPLMLTDTATTCIAKGLEYERKIEEAKGDEVILKCAKIEVLMEGV